MAITNGYATLAEIKTYLSTSANTDDSRLERAIEAASREIDMRTRRRFYATTATKFLDPVDSDYVSLDDDLLSVTSLAVDLGNRNYSILDPSTYELDPSDAPYQAVYVAPQSQEVFTVGRRGVRIIGSWGYNATGSPPDAIKQACLILAVRYFKRRDAAFGVLGTPELGYTRIAGKDPEVSALLAAYRRMEVYGV